MPANYNNTDFVKPSGDGIAARRRIEAAALAYQRMVQERVAEITPPPAPKPERKLIYIDARPKGDTSPTRQEMPESVFRSIVALHRKDASRSIKGKRTPEGILHLVCRHMGITIYELKSQRRQMHLVVARQLAASLLRRYTSLSFPAIGNMMGGRDHSTILYACGRHERRRAERHKARDALWTS